MRNYQDYLYVNEDQVMEAGFEPKNPKIKCGTTYYVSDTCEYVLVVARDGFQVILDKAMYSEIGDSSIYVKYREYHNSEDEPIPCVSDKWLHRVVMDAPKGIQVDHINHNQNCSVKENLRFCNNSQNTLNRQDKCGVYEQFDTEGTTLYGYALKVDACEEDRITLLKDKGFIKMKNRKGKATFRSNDVYESKVDCYLAYRDSARALYKGTEKEDFIYDIENDFSETLGLLIHYYIIGDITKEEMYQMNLDYWRDSLDNEPSMRRVV